MGRPGNELGLIGIVLEKPHHRDNHEVIWRHRIVMNCNFSHRFERLFEFGVLKRCSVSLNLHVILVLGFKSFHHNSTQSSSMSKEQFLAILNVNLSSVDGSHQSFTKNISDLSIITHVICIAAGFVNVHNTFFFCSRSCGILVDWMCRSYSVEYLPAPYLFAYTADDVIGKENVFFCVNFPHLI